MTDRFDGLVFGIFTSSDSLVGLLSVGARRQEVPDFVYSGCCGVEPASHFGESLVDLSEAVVDVVTEADEILPQADEILP